MILKNHILINLATALFFIDKPIKVMETPQPSNEKTVTKRKKSLFVVPLHLQKNYSADFLFYQPRRKSLIIFNNTNFKF